MLTTRQREERNKVHESIRLTRVENLRRLMEGYGSWAELGRQTGHSVPFLCHVAGPNPRRQIGEKLARDIEAALRLKSGWLDVAR